MTFNINIFGTKFAIIMILVSKEIYDKGFLENLKIHHKVLVGKFWSKMAKIGISSWGVKLWNFFSIEFEYCVKILTKMNLNSWFYSTFNFPKNNKREGTFIWHQRVITFLHRHIVNRHIVNIYIYIILQNHNFYIVLLPLTV